MTEAEWRWQHGVGPQPPYVAPPEPPRYRVRDYSADEVMDGISSALKDRDLPAAVSLLHVLAVKDPASAQVIYDTIRLEARTDACAAP